MAPADQRFCRVRSKRACDLARRDVVRIAARQIVRIDTDKPISLGHVEDRERRTKVDWEWREVLGTYDSTARLETEFGPTAEMDEQLRVLAEFAFERYETCYVLVHLLIHEDSTDDLVSVFVVLYRNALVETQSLPAWDAAPVPDPAQKFIQAAAQNAVVADDFTDGNAVFNELVEQAREVARELGIDYVPGEGTDIEGEG